MVTDTEGSGTTVLTAGNAAELPPHFGEASAAAHRAAGAVYVRGTPDVRCDVDTVLDLARARVLGLGQHTLALLGELDLAGDASLATVAIMATTWTQATVHTFDEAQGSGSVITDRRSGDHLRRCGLGGQPPAHRANRPARPGGG